MAGDGGAPVPAESTQDPDNTEKSRAAGTDRNAQASGTAGNTENPAPRNPENPGPPENPHGPETSDGGADEADETDGADETDRADEAGGTDEIGGADEARGRTGLSGRERSVLAFERRPWVGPGAKERAIGEELGMAPVRYYQLLNALLDDPYAEQHDPVTVHRLRRVREDRRRRRDPATPGAG